MQLLTEKKSVSQALERPGEGKLTGNLRLKHDLGPFKFQVACASSEGHKMAKPGPAQRMTNPVGTSKVMDPIGRAASDLVAQEVSTAVHGDKTGLSVPSYVAGVTPMNRVTIPVQVSGKSGQETKSELGARLRT